jgi:hypothetical protein
MRKKIFVGSSHVDRALAESVCAHLSRQADVEGICWRPDFEEWSSGKGRARKEK